MGRRDQIYRETDDSEFALTIYNVNVRMLTIYSGTKYNVWLNILIKYIHYIHRHFSEINNI